MDGDVTPGTIEAVTVAEVIDAKLLPAAAGRRRRSSTAPMSRSYNRPSASSSKRRTIGAP
jgi:hypothetical protein